MTDAYVLGHEASSSGQLKSANPYKPGGECFDLWNEGWDDADIEIMGQADGTEQKTLTETNNG